MSKRILHASWGGFVHVRWPARKPSLDSSGTSKQLFRAAEPDLALQPRASIIRPTGAGGEALRTVGAVVGAIWSERESVAPLARPAVRAKARTR